MKKFPMTKDLMKKLEKAEGTKALSPNATPLEQFRFSIQQKFVAYKVKHACSQRELAEKLEVDEAKISKILNHRLDEFSTDRLITLYQKINPNVKFAIV